MSSVSESVSCVSSLLDNVESKVSVKCGGKEEAKAAKIAQRQQASNNAPKMGKQKGGKGR